jgi:hypothetical protein
MEFSPLVIDLIKNVTYLLVLGLPIYFVIRWRVIGIPLEGV